ncbi:MAG: sigma-54-dependent Fis family transcriptional regulator [bacterium]|nr:sigma-54-dependent Fis family transcriptional regulator [bacterium]
MKKTLYPVCPVLLVDDEEQFLSTAAFILKGGGITNIAVCSDSRKVMPLLEAQDYSAVVLDLTMPYVDGRELLTRINEDFPDMPVLVLTAINEVDSAVQCMKEGALDYLVKPVQRDTFVASVARALKFREIQEENSRLKKYILSDKLAHPETFAGIVTESKQMHAIFKYLEAVAGTPLPVLIMGETGVGKESIAKVIHTLSDRDGLFVPINAAGLDDTLFSDTLFGHKKGSFSGAAGDRKGMLEAAAGGTLFLDEIGDLSIASQVKLLRLLQDGSYYPLGSDAPKKTDARFVFATNVDLEGAVARGAFRKDLYYRLRSHLVRLPALRERVEDIPLLFTYFLEEAAELMNKKVPVFPAQLITLLSTYPFPGNIRELQTMVNDALARHQQGVLSMSSFKELTAGPIVNDETADGFSRKNGADLLKLFNGRFPTLKEVEAFLVSEALEMSDNNQGIAASLLGLTRNALNKRLIRRKAKD